MGELPEYGEYLGRGRKPWVFGKVFWNLKLVAFRAKIVWAPLGGKKPPPGLLEEGRRRFFKKPGRSNPSVKTGGVQSKRPRGVITQGVFLGAPPLVIIRQPRVFG